MSGPRYGARATAAASQGLPGEWADDASCRGKAGKRSIVFFPAGEDLDVAAKRICATCPSQAACLEFALATDQQHGIWGGRNESERRAIALAGAPNDLRSVPA